MTMKRHYYVLRLQYLGFRYSGWQKQPGQKTIEGMLSKTLKFILPDRKFKMLGSGRTDAKVSAWDAAFELFLEGMPITDHGAFVELFNRNLPPDIRIMEMAQVTKDFNIIQQSRSKEYVYLFSFGAKNHPFCAPFLCNVMEELDIGLMSKAALLFVGTHDFSLSPARRQEHTKVVRSVTACEIRPNHLLEANFFPEKSFAFIVRGEGFMRYQVRMMMGALIQLGKGAFTLRELERSLTGDTDIPLDYIAPGSGLFLNKLEFK